MNDMEDKEEIKIEKSWKEVINKPKKLEFILGKQGAHYRKYCGFTIQPQNYPDAIHHVSTLLK